MPQPDYVPLQEDSKVRSTERLPVAEPWRPERPAEIPASGPPKGRRLGTTGPDQGYGLKLAKQVGEQVQLAPGEHKEDVMAGCTAIGLKRAAINGRAPVIYDMELAFGVWGFLDAAPAELIAFRSPLFAGAAHDYWTQRDIVDRVKDETLRLAHTEVRRQVNVWRELLNTD
ncbi:MAG: hypothetical protein JOZ37_03810 [Actinobacteria bacterium]|nr:hypothetical protein [Actinomycetota bacterium]